ncbi:MAG: hypothetical protein MPK62_02355 [Alphaproteobacteria bacterium]|nr:hypothetical protein [Alphaproteobacteria bacterium]MDA8029977.1 hypothetical protein [Alphaproteobacteria bacterium]
MGIFEYLVWKLGRLGSMPRDRLKAVVILGTTLVVVAIMIGVGVSTLQPPDPDGTFQDRQARMHFHDHRARMDAGEPFRDSKPVLEFLDDGRASLRIYGTTYSDYVERCLDLGGEPDLKIVFIVKYLCYVEPDTIVGSEDECIQRGGKYSVVYVTNGPVQICQ